ncbi:hypothetical protein [Companilactobacillus kimchiensis]|uniref:Lipoprotein n=1 Tax=Companilactobacillus kimchiensis TaxID=993692 RepID=A0A0R2LFC1_9LACO|nr:hypothetical protein [Companilactobacillus kimchiensis]KRO00526.1 hypothetical protein IV57_GL000962 [Companilactobacillus kimchiensis]
MKKVIKVLGVILLCCLILVGCSQKSSTDNKGDLVIKNNSFSGKFVTSDDNKMQTMSVHFTNDNRAVVATSWYSGEEHLWMREVMSGDYTISKRKILIQVKKAMDEGFVTKKDMNNNAIPTKMVKTVVKNPNLELKIQKKYLMSNSTNKLRPTTKVKINDYNSFLNNDQKRYDHKYAKLSRRSFMSPATDLMGNGIAFKGSNFIWKYGGSSDYNNGLDQGGSLAVFTGTYKLENQKLTLFVYEKTNLYEGTIFNLGKKHYQSYIAANSLPNKFVFKFTKNNKLHLLTNSQYLTMTDMLDYGTVTGTPNYDEWIKKYNVGTIESTMQQSDLSNIVDTNSDSDNAKEHNRGISVKDSDDDSDFKFYLDSADDFESFLADQNMIDLDSDREYHVEEGNGHNFEISDSDRTVSAKYQVSWDVDDGSITHIIILGNDGKVYEANSGEEMTLDTDATDAYNNLE